MQFRLAGEEESFRQEVKRILKNNPPVCFPVQGGDFGWGWGCWSNEFLRFMGDNGWISMMWPKEHGGQERPLTELLVLLEELALARAPMAGAILALCTSRDIISFGNEILKEEILPGVAKGEITLWEAMTEPEAGSDLLSLKTRAVEEKDYYVINGQKTFNGHARLADYAYLLARTDPNLPKHRGLSMFLVNKSLPGVTVRPLKDLALGYELSEVFLDDVKVAKEYLVGEKNHGLDQMLSFLEGDRFLIRFAQIPFARGILEDLVKYCKETRRDGMVLAKDSMIRHKLAESAIEIEVCRVLFYRAASVLKKGGSLTFEALMPKILVDESVQRLYSKGVEIMTLYQTNTKWAAFQADMCRWYLCSMAYTVGGGTAEIIRNTVARRVLTLPQT